MFSIPWQFFNAIGQNFHCCLWLNIEQIILQSGLTGHRRTLCLEYGSTLIQFLQQ